ncbi:MAG: hypothetical protein A2Y25_08700 [Candidatus Melainabacteria bacterium GWF2_37_15]|nr:MAG: hypothetical protein A2Y25_08700 [Candidatus Melainabacteria bacterium GWF2_37_15]
MKKSSLIVILAIFVIPLALYFFFKMPSGNDFAAVSATPGKAKLLQFTSPMCYDCNRIEKELAPLKTAAEYKNTIIFEKIDVSKRTPAVDQLITKYNVDVVPTLVFLDKNGNMINREQGYMAQQQLRECLDRIK